MQTYLKKVSYMCYIDHHLPSCVNFFYASQTYLMCSGGVEEVPSGGVRYTLR